MNRIQRNMKDYKVDKESFSDSFRKEVYEVISQIPVGKYLLMEVLPCFGVPQCSRMVGRALKEVPDGLLVPCHRVVNSAGRLVPGWVEQKQLLLAEGIAFKANGCVNLKEHLWQADE